MERYGASDTFDSENASMEERLKERKAERVFQRLAEQGRFADIDKARHNNHYRDYLLENQEDIEGFHGKFNSFHS